MFSQTKSGRSGAFETALSINVKRCTALTGRMFNSAAAASESASPAATNNCSVRWSLRSYAACRRASSDAQPLPRIAANPTSKDMHNPHRDSEGTFFMNHPP
jgi:hypothetical protein